jgi:hypothetical protein
MSGDIPALPPYAFMAWTGTTLRSVVLVIGMFLLRIAEVGFNPLVDLF